eukprot:32902_1
MADFFATAWPPPIQKPKAPNLYFYSGRRDEKVPKDVTHVIVKDNVKAIWKEAFHYCRFLVYVRMGNSVKRIEKSAFSNCTMLQVVILSNTLEYIGEFAFNTCRSLEGLILPPTVTEIVQWAFDRCYAMKLLILPSDINVENGVDVEIISGTALSNIAEAAGIRYETFVIENIAEQEQFQDLVELDQEQHQGHNLEEDLGGNVIENLVQENVEENWAQDNFNFAAFEENWAQLQGITDESFFGFNNWLIHHMDNSPFHKLCYDVSVTASKISDYLDEHGHDSALQVDAIHGMLPLHMLARNPHASVDAILTLLKANTNAVNVMDFEKKTPMHYALTYNPCSFVRIYSYFHEHDMQNKIQSLMASLDGSGKVPLHDMVVNPLLPATTIVRLLNLQLESAFCVDNRNRAPLDYAKDCNADGLISMITLLCNHRNSMASLEKSHAGET